MATLYGHIAVLHPESEFVMTSFECIQLYFIGNKVPEDLQVLVLLSFISTPITTSTATSSLCSKPLQDILETLCCHLDPKLGSDCPAL